MTHALLPTDLDRVDEPQAASKYSKVLSLVATKVNR